MGTIPEGKSCKGLSLKICRRGLAALGYFQYLHGSETVLQSSPRTERAMESRTVSLTSYPLQCHSTWPISIMKYIMLHISFIQHPPVDHLLCTVLCDMVVERRYHLR